MNASSIGEAPIMTVDGIAMLKEQYQGKLQSLQQQLDVHRQITTPTTTITADNLIIHNHHHPSAAAKKSTFTAKRHLRAGSLVSQA